MRNQRTLKTSGALSGVGLHTGNECKLTFVPAPADYGFKFVRADLPGSPEIPALLENVVDVKRGTTIALNGVQVHTVEHCLSAMAGLGLNNVRVELTADEPPVLDGSAAPFVQLLHKCGLEEQTESCNVLEIDDVITFRDEAKGIDIVVVPSDRFRVTYMIDYQNPALGTQYTSLYDLEREYIKEFASARTFAFLSEIKMLFDAGLIRGGRIENAMVIADVDLTQQELDGLKRLLGITDEVKVSPKGIIGEKMVRFPNEPVRHKVVDLIGDLALLGMPVKAHVLCARAGHPSHVELVKLFKKEAAKKALQQKYSTGGKSADKAVFDVSAIQRILPHRYPFLLVDRIIELVPNERVTAIKNVTVNEPFFQGHFPERPIMPGVLLVEALGQAGGVLLLNTAAEPNKKLVYFTGLEGVRFRKLVVPGDQLILKVEMVFYKRNICRMKGQAFVDGQLAAEAEMQAVVVNRS
ncbi:MAG: bifunctional UDP-3-O-[3-hydroxymyristoyl] N-acetylglucosamine deacetylase/3-hydroxyacyl-ACP dehydratase [Calditrichaeota bacterium]|nr:bifunctional UDP-3-O-[3-hydroxymyristoyl] N-acetylglucosamine deacetylase/3-hydroxyacyl-ACP dehydratase [Calditrichota bacterium]